MSSVMLAIWSTCKHQLTTCVRCRAHWLLAMQQEWQASQLADPYFMQLSKARALRCRLEALHDVGCGRLVEENAKQWGALPMEC